MADRALGTLSTFILLICIVQGNFNSRVLIPTSPHVASSASFEMAFGFQPTRCEVAILSDCIPTGSVQYPLQNVSHLVCVPFLAHNAI